MKWIPRRKSRERENRDKTVDMSFRSQFFFVSIIKQLLRLPTMSTIFILWNMNFNYHKEIAFGVSHGEA
jgi:hypothetical protein